MSKTEQERYELLVTKLTDGLINSGERAELERLVADNPERTDEVRGFGLIVATSDALSLRMQAAADLDPVHGTPTSRALFPLSWVLMIGGFCVLEGWVLWTLLADAETPLIVKACTASIVLGATLLFSYLLVRRVTGDDPYNQIDQ